MREFRRSKKGIGQALSWTAFIDLKVVCIKADWKPKLFIPVEFPIKGEIYHIDEVVEVEGYGTCLKLRELTKTETVWRAENFRPVDYSFGEKAAI